MRVLIACEFSGVVRNAFLRLGYDAWSCDLLASEDDSPNHIIGDALDLLVGDWDLIIAHPPCTRLCNSGVRWLDNPPPGKSKKQMQKELKEGAYLFSAFLNTDCRYVAIENPTMHKHAKRLIRNYVECSQSVQPYQFGHAETKRTCLWLKGLPDLRSTEIIQDGIKPRSHMMADSAGRWKKRSRTHTGIADAMAKQWGDYVSGKITG